VASTMGLCFLANTHESASGPVASSVFKTVDHMLVCPHKHAILVATRPADRYLTANWERLGAERFPHLPALGFST
jgi:hypothetical protein